MVEEDLLQLPPKTVQMFLMLMGDEEFTVESVAFAACMQMQSLARLENPMIPLAKKVSEKIFVQKVETYSTLHSANF